jgi:hypothetical protein
VRKSPFPIKSYIPVAVLAERGVDAKSLVCKINSTFIARVVFFSRIRIPQILASNVIEDIRQSQSKIVIVAANPSDPGPMIKAVDLLSLSSADVRVLVSGDLDKPRAIVEAMNVGAREFVERTAKVYEISEAIRRHCEPPPDDLNLGLTPTPPDSGPSGGSAPLEDFFVGVRIPRGPKTLPPRKAIPESRTIFPT